MHSVATRRLIAWFILLFLASIWPIYPAFNRIYPFVFGIPFSLFYLVCLTTLSFVTLLTFHLRDRSADE